MALAASEKSSQGEVKLVPTELLNHWNLNENAYQEYRRGKGIALDCPQVRPLLAEHHERVVAADTAGKPRPTVLSTVEMLMREGREIDDQNAVLEVAHQRKHSRAESRVAQSGVEHDVQKHPGKSVPRGTPAVTMLTASRR